MNMMTEAFTGNAEMDLDINDIRNQAALKKEAAWSMPLGIPDCVNLKLVMGEIAGKTGLYSTAKKDKNIKRMINDSNLLDRLASALPLPKKQVVALGSREKILASILIMPGERRKLRNSQLEKKRTDGVFEFYLINRYYKKIKKEPLFKDFDSFREKGEMSVLREDEDISAMDALLIILATGQDRFCGFSLMCMGVDGMLERAYRDVLEDTTNASDAAAFIFAVSSMTDCRWFFDHIYQSNFEIAEKHFGGLFYASLIEEREEGADAPFVTRYSPIDLDLTSEQTKKVFWVHAQSLRLRRAEIMVEDISEMLEFDFNDPLSIYDGIEEALDLTATCEIMLKSFRKDLQDLAIYRMPTHMSEQVERLEKSLDNFFSIMSYDGEKPDSSEVRAGLEKLCEIIPKAKSHRSAIIISSLMDINQVADQIEECLDDILAQHKRATKSFQELSVNPGKNVDKLQETLSELADIDAEVVGVRDACQKHLDSISSAFSEACIQIQKEAGEDPDASEQPLESEDPTAEDSKDLEDLLTLSESENQSLQKKLRDLTAQNEHLTTALAQQREQESLNGASEEARELIKRKFITGERLSVEECLKLVHVLYPDTVILPSAWASAADYTDFQNTDKLSEYLMTLASDYIDAIVSGTPDGEARKLFPSRVFAANESETTESGSLRKDREFMWEGKMHYFPKHLRIGISSDTRKTIRVYFDVIDGKLVIASCGEHKRIL